MSLEAEKYVAQVKSGEGPSWLSEDVPSNWSSEYIMPDGRILHLHSFSDDSAVVLPMIVEKEGRYEGVYDFTGARVFPHYSEGHNALVNGGWVPPPW